jgi:DNA-binding NtrC family response regulator
MLLQARDNVSKVQALLEESFHCVTRAYTMAEALAAIAKQPFDLFLIDHEPASGESACPLLTAIMSDNSMSHIPSIGSPRPSTLAPAALRNSCRWD